MPASPCLGINRRTALGVAVSTLAGAPLLGAHAADKYPGKPVTVIVPYTAGGSTDVVARLIAQKLTESLGQTFIVDNKAGANGIIGMDIAARAEPNGYTLLLNTAGAQVLTPVIYKTKFHALDSWEPVSLISTIPLVVVAREGLPVKNFAEFVQLARSGSPPLTASSGSSMVVLVTDQLKRVIGAPTLAGLLAPKGTPREIVQMLSEQVQKIVRSAEVQERLKGFDHTPIGSNAADFTKLISEDYARWQRVVKDTGFKIDA